MCQKKKVCFGGIKKPLICLGLILFLMGGVLHFGFAHAQGLVKPEMAFPEYYPYGFHGMGYILDITLSDIVIDDILFAFSTDVVCHTLETENASSAFFILSSVRLKLSLIMVYSLHKSSQRFPQNDTF